MSSQASSDFLSISFPESLLSADPFGSLSDLPDFDLSPLGGAAAVAELLNCDGLPLPLDAFVSLSPPHSHDYPFSLEDHEGISELFDCDFSDLSKVLGDGYTSADPCSGGGV